MFPIHLNLGFTVFYFYEGLYFAIAIGIGILWTVLRIKKQGLYLETVENLLIWTLVGAVVVGRLSHFLFWNWDYFIHDPLSLFRPWEGGISITGGLIGGIATAIIYTKLKKIDFWHYFAVASPAILLAQGIGRIGCFLNGDAFGIAAAPPWGVRFPRYGTLIPPFKLDTTHSSAAWRWSYEHGKVALDSLWSAPLYPTQLYEMLGDFLLMGIVLLLFRALSARVKNFRPFFFIHTGGYALLRFLLEFIRGDREQVIASINMSYLQITLLSWALFSFFMIIIPPLYRSMKKA